MKVGLRSIDGCPAQEMWLGCGRGAFVEVAAHSNRLAFVPDAEKSERNGDHDTPYKRSFHLFERSPANRGISSDGLELVGRKRAAVGPSDTFSRVEDAYAVELESEIVGRRWIRLQIEFHARILAHGRVVGVAGRAEVIAAHKKVDVDGLGSVGRRYNRQGAVGKCLRPVERFYGEACAPFLKSVAHGVETYSVEPFAKGDMKQSVGFHCRLFEIDVGRWECRGVQTAR